jgi:hypothetical protein
MRLGYLTAIAALASLTGCSQANAAIDSSEDVHCYVVTYYFSDLARSTGAPADQQRAAAVVADWYAARAARLGDADTVLAGATPLLKRIVANPKAAIEKGRECSRRAAADPGFDAFVRAYPS